MVEIRVSLAPVSGIFKIRQRRQPARRVIGEEMFDLVAVCGSDFGIS